MESELIAPLVFLAVTLFCYWAGSTFHSAVLRVQVARQTAAPEDQTSVNGPWAQLRPLVHDITLVLRRNPAIARWIDRQADRYRLPMQRAGMPGLISPDEFYVVKLLAPILTFSLTFLAVGTQQWHWALLAAGVAFILPDLKIRDIAQRRVTELRLALPEALDCLALMMRAGLDLGQAIDYYIDDDDRNPLQQEFYILRSQMRLGKSRAEAFRAMAQRLNLEEFDTIATAVIEGERTGVSMSAFFTSQADEVRERRFQAAEEQGQKAPFKLMAPLMLLIMPCVFVILFAPMILRYVRGEF